MEAIRVRGLSKRYKEFELKGIDITLPKGYIMGFIGENGAGKSTTIKLILNAIKRDAGEIFVLGEDNRVNEHIWKNDVGVVYDAPCFSDNMKLKDINIVMKNIYKNWDREKFFFLAKRLLISENKEVKQYSRGMKMKLSIAVALAHNPKLLILDEPTSGLDPVVRNEILDILLEFVQDEEHSVFLSSHITGDLEKICDYITFIHNGEIILSENKDDLLNKFGIVKCSKEEFLGIPKECINAYRENEFGVEVLVDKTQLKTSAIIDRATLEDIMLYHIKGVR